MPTLRASSAEPLIGSFWSGAQVAASKPVTDFLAPIVPVPTSLGFYKRRTADSRLGLPDANRPLTSRAIQLAVTLEDAPYDCAPQGLDYPIDKIVSEAELQYLTLDGIAMVADMQSRLDEIKVIQTAVAGAGAGVDVAFTGSDPVQIIDGYILALILAAKCDQVGVCFSPSAWDKFKNNDTVIARAKGDVSFQSCPNLFHAGAEFMTAYAIYDAAPLSAAPQVQFVMPANTVLIFARQKTSNKSDPSYMKRFALTAIPELWEEATGRPPVRVMEREDRRVDNVQVDWSEDCQITNTAGATLIVAT
jgi:hypothetical protein